MIETDNINTIDCLKDYLVNDYYRQNKKTDKDMNLEIVAILKSNYDDLDPLESIKYKVFVTICEAILGKEKIFQIQFKDAELSSIDFREDDSNMEFYIEIIKQYGNQVLKFIKKLSKHNDLFKNSDEKGDETTEHHEEDNEITEHHDEDYSFDNYEDDEIDNAEEMAGRKLFYILNQECYENEVFVKSLKELIAQLTSDASQYLHIFGLLLIYENTDELRKFLLENHSNLNHAQQLYISKLEISIGPDALFYYDISQMLTLLYTDKSFWMNSCINAQDKQEMTIALQKDLEDQNQRHLQKEKERNARQKIEKEKKDKDIKEVYEMALIQEKEKNEKKETKKNIIRAKSTGKIEESEETNSKEDTKISETELDVSKLNIKQNSENKELYDLVMKLQNQLIKVEKNLATTMEDLSNTNKKVDDLTVRLDKITIRGVLVNFARYLKFAKAEMPNNKKSECQRSINFLYNLKDKFNILAHTIPEKLEEIVFLNITAELKAKNKEELLKCFNDYKPFFKRKSFYDYITKNHLLFSIDKALYLKISSSFELIN